MEFLPESDMSVFADTDSIICEGEDLTLLESEHVTMCNGSVCVQRYLDDVIAEQFMSMISKKVKFII